MTPSGCVLKFLRNGAAPVALSLFAFSVFSAPAIALDAASKAARVALLEQSSNPFSSLVGEPRRKRSGQRLNGKIERYVLAADDRSFLFEDLVGEARIKFLCHPGDTRVECVIDPFGPAEEIYSVAPNRAPRGDTIYKNTEGETLLRIASYGGATVYWPGENEGAAASKSFGETKSLTLPYADYETAMLRAQNATAMISAVTGAPIVFDIGKRPADEDETGAVLADAVVLATKAIKRVAADPTGARILSNRISVVRFSRGAAAAYVLDGDTLTITYSPKQGLNGRPTSSAIRNYLESVL